jgi:hypothetical protein
MEIREYITEQLDNVISESIGSERLRELFSKNRNGKVFIPRHIDNELQWDKITDDDIEEWSTEEARRLAYKKSEGYYILWVDGSGAFLGRTIGNWLVFSVNMWHGKPEYGTAKALSIASDKAYVVKDYERFSTRELRASRQKAKEGATALMSAAKIAEENIKRYKSILSERRLQEINFGDVVDSVKKVTESYASIIGAINDDVICSPDFKETLRNLTDLETAYHSIMDVFKEILNKYRQYEDWKNYSNDSMVNWARKDILKGVNNLQNLIDKFNDKYIP